MVSFVDTASLSSSFLGRNVEVTVFLGVLSASLLSLWAMKEMKGRPRRPPPGPMGMPVLGILPFLGDAAYLTFTCMAEKFGNVFQVYMGSRRTVVVNGVKAARQVLVIQSEDFAGRPDFESFKLIAEGKSMAFGQYGDRVKLHKKLARSAIRQFTLNTAARLEEDIWHQGNLLVQDLLQSNGEPICVYFPIKIAVASIIYGLCFGSSKSCRDDKEFIDFLATQNAFTDLQKAGGNPADLIPSLSMFLQHRLKTFITITNKFKVFQARRRTEHLETYDPKKMRDVTDALIKTAEEYPKDAMDAVGLTKEHIMNTTAELIGAGQNTVSATLTWLVLYMVSFPDVQARVQAEIDEVLQGEQPQYGDRKKMPYTEAVLYESWRFSAQVPFLLPHSTTRDTTLFDYDVPKDTLIFVNMWSVCRDPDVWSDPHTFDPTRFLDEDGFVDKSKAEDVFAFGGGKRRCLGEFLARQESFIFFTMLLQRLSFEKAAGESYDLKGKFGLSLESHDYKYIIRERRPKVSFE